MRILWTAFMGAIGRHRVHAGVFGGSLLLVVAGWLWAFVVLRGNENPLILRWGDGVGIAQIGRMGDLSALGIFGLVVVLMNAMIAFDLENRDVVWGKVMAVGTVFCAILIFISFAAIIAVN